MQSPFTTHLDDRIDADLLARHTGQQRVSTVRAARDAHAVAAGAARDAARRLRAGRLVLLVARVRMFAARYGVAPVIDAMVVSTVPATLLSAAAIRVGTNLPTLVTIVLSCYGVLGGLLTWFFHGSYESRAARTRECAHVLARHAAGVARLKAISDAASHEHARAAALLDGVRLAAEATDRRRRRVDEIAGLLRVDCRTLSGSEFERFLAEVFRLHGYAVQPTGQSGDQGVDLIVQRPGGPRLAVQAKCYSGSVGNDAVQQAFAGMAFHGCQGCALVTNSYTTRAANELAARVGCAVIDGARLPELIRGNIQL